MRNADDNLKSEWLLDKDITFLNHGSFGACLKSVIAKQQEFVRQLESEPVRFFIREAESQLDLARREFAKFIGADSEDLVFVPNATAGVNTVLRSLEFHRGDVLVTTNHAYNACRNALEFVANQHGIEIVVAKVPFPVCSNSDISSGVLNAVSRQTKLVLLDHVTSPTAIIFPISDIINELSCRGIDVLVDGAHAPGMIPLDVSALGAAYYTGNCHKWLCAPKGAGFLHVRRDKQHLIRPLSISHGANSKRRDRSLFQLEFGWTGTADVSSYLCVPHALAEMSRLVAGAWPEIMCRNHELALKGRDILCRDLGVEMPCPNNLLGSMATIPLPAEPQLKTTSYGTDPLQDELLYKHNIEVPVVHWDGRRAIRISAQLYNKIDDYECLASALKSSL